MSKVRNLAEIAPTLAFSEFDFYDLYRSTFENSELGRIMRLLPLREMTEDFGLASKSRRQKLGRKAFFAPQGKVALMFLKMYTGLSGPKLMEQLNGNIHYQMFCNVIIDPPRPLSNYRLLDGSFGTQKERYDLKKVKARTKKTEILYIFFGIHTANVVQLADRIEKRAKLAAA